MGLLDFGNFGSVSALFDGRKISNGSVVGDPCACQFAVGVPMEGVGQRLLSDGLIFEDIGKVILPIALF